MMETYSYAADGKRRQKVTGSGTTNFVWDGENVLAEQDQNQVTQAQYTHSPGIWGGLTSQRRLGVSSFYAFDLAGNTRALTSPAAAITDSYSYKAFGPELPGSASTTNPHRYCGVLGYYRDNTTRQYVRARHLRVDSGRWMSRDPIGDLGSVVGQQQPRAGGFNARTPTRTAGLRPGNLRVSGPTEIRPAQLYAYAYNNPVALADPSGLIPNAGCWLRCMRHSLQAALLGCIAASSPCGRCLIIASIALVAGCIASEAAFVECLLITIKELNPFFPCELFCDSLELKCVKGVLASTAILAVGCYNFANRPDCEQCEI
jgi:hypothetical protein